jgi:hypothetical protein
MIVAIAAAGDRHIDGEDKGRAVSRGCLRQQILHESAVADHVELKPEGLCCRMRDFSQRASADRRESEGDACTLSRADRLALTAPGVETGKANRSQSYRQRLFLAEQFGCQVHAGNIAQHPLAQRDIRQFADILAQRDFGIGAAVDIFEEETGQAAAGGFTKIGDAGYRHGTDPQRAGSLIPASHRER